MGIMSRLRGFPGKRHNPEIHEGVRRKGCSVDARLIYIIGIRGHAAQGVDHLDQGIVEVDAERELQFDLGESKGGRGDETLQAAHAAQVLFLLDEDLFFDILWSSARPVGANGDGAHLQIGDHLHRYLQGSNDPQHDHDERAHGDQNSVFDHGLEHDSFQWTPYSGRLMMTLCPSRSASLPCTTTVVLAAKPLVIATLPLKLRPV